MSKLLVMLDREAALTRSDEGKVASVDLARLLERWAEDAPLASRTSRTGWIEPKGLAPFIRRLPEVGLRYAVTSSLAAARKAPVAAPRLATVYVDDAEDFARTLGLRPAEAGANVVLLVPGDEAVFEDTWQEDGVRYAALAQVAADLLSSPGRGPAEAEALMGWMTTHEERWRG